jgi:outer membrane protein OmpA-like peptidoglycan-associated protein
MSYCTQCGSPQAEGQAFCTACGAARSPASVTQSVGAFRPVQPAPPVAVQNAPPVASIGHGLRTFLIVAAVVLFFMLGLGIGGAWYVGHKVKEKAEAVLHPYAEHPTAASAALADAARVASGTGREPLSDSRNAAASFPAWIPAANTTTDPAGPAPLKEGMLVVTAVADEQGDYESMKQVTRIEPSGTTLSYHADLPRNSSQKQVDGSRTVLAEDLLSAHDYAEHFGTDDPPSYPGTTAISASRDVLAELKTSGHTNFSFRRVGGAAALASLVGNLAAIAGTDAKDTGGDALEKMGKEECVLERASNGLFAFPVLLNQERTVLPAVHAHCATDDGPAEFYILDQAAYPLMLSFKLGEGSQLQVIKITYPAQKKPTAAPDKLEQDLQEKKKVEIYGIYFHFASDRLKPESTPVLQEIARVMRAHPDWKLSVSGHTDNIGGDAYNLDLSQRRTAAVKQALITEYSIAPERLATDGYGSSRPVDTNDTLEGRARNRRVELVRE